MNEQEYNSLREASWRRPLTPAEKAALQSYLAAHSEAREAWELDRELNTLLDVLPPTPTVSSNFTTRVLQAVELEESGRARGQSRKRPSLWNSLRSWFPKAATALIVIGSILAVHHQHEVNRVAMAHDVANLTQIVSASGPEVLQDFEPIRHLDDSQAKADTELLALFK